MKLELPGTPPSTNHMYPQNKMGRRYLSPEGAAYKKAVSLAARLLWGPTPSKRPIMIQVVFQFADKRRRDINNFDKALFDSLSGVCWLDDSQVVDWHATKMIGKEPRTIIKVQEVN